MIHEITTVKIIVDILHLSVFYINGIAQDHKSTGYGGGKTGAF